MKQPENGRKFYLTTVFLVQGLAVLGASYILALNGKLTGDWVQLVTIWLPMSGVVIGGFQATNAYVSGKAIQAGQEPPKGTES